MQVAIELATLLVAITNSKHPQLISIYCSILFSQQNFVVAFHSVTTSPHRSACDIDYPVINFTKMAVK